jgi:NAD(P)H-dependent flavin oxidoreductase YrpB (nitropropane dioxygenase family)
MLRTPLCDLLGIDVPIMNAAMGPDLTGPELVAAVSNAGGLGILQAQLHSSPLFREAIRRVRDLTEKPFGVNFILAFPHEENLAICLEERVPVLSLFWGDASPYVEPAHAAGVKVLVQVGSVASAQRSVRAGVDVIIAQGIEAGGHSPGQVATMALVPRVVDAVAPTPVIAAGGIADARGLVAALALGADGVVMGTRFLASAEANTHPLYQQKLLAATEEETVHTMAFGKGWPNAPHRALRTAFVEEWMGNPRPTEEAKPDEGAVGETRIAGQAMPVPRFVSLPPNRAATGDVEAMSLLAGQSVGLVHEVKPAATIIREMVTDARRIIEQRLRGTLAVPEVVQQWA